MDRQSSLRDIVSNQPTYWNMPSDGENDHGMADIKQPDTANTTPAKMFDSFRRGHVKYAASDGRKSVDGSEYNIRRAAKNTANTALVRRLKGRHLQMIAIGGSIGTGLFIGTGKALFIGGPGSLLISFTAIGAVLYCTVQALGEMAILYPVAGSFSAFSTRFLDPAWGFAMGWNYAMQWLIVMPLEIIAAVSTLEYWALPIPQGVSITIFLVSVFGINLFGVKAFGEAEFLSSVLKASAVTGFIILGVIIDCAGNQSSGYIGGSRWLDPGAFRSGFQGFCNVLVTASFAFSGTELVGLAAAETYNPTKSIPTAVKQVFWRISMFYILSVLIIGLLIRSDDTRLLNGATESATSPFVIAILDAGLKGLDSVMNAVILIAVLSVANSSFFGSSRTLAALADQNQAPAILGYVDRKGRPIVSVGVAAVFGLLAYFGVGDLGDDVFTWLLAVSGLSSIFTWATICLSHIRFRHAWKAQGHSLDELVYRSPVGIYGSWVGFICLMLVLVLQLWVAVDPVGAARDRSLSERVSNFFAAYLAAPIVLLFYAYFKIVHKTRWVQIDKVDLVTGRYTVNGRLVARAKEDMSGYPIWKKVYKMLC